MTSTPNGERAGIPRFDRRFFASEEVASRIGGGALGGKAEGLIRIKDALAERFADRPVAGIEISIPRMVVLGTDAFDWFMEHGGLYEMALSGAPDDRIAHAFQKADLPPELVGDLRAIVEDAHTPLAVRSSSLLEDALAHPFAGVYETKMIPNHQPDPGTRFARLVEAIKLVYASAFLAGARSYRKAIGADDRAEKMAVVIQEVVGARHGERFYPTLSAVCRSFSYYPVGAARPEDGVAQLALGLGKTIVDGGVCWSYSPRFPDTPPPFASPRSMLKETQTSFWAVNMGNPPAYDPIAEVEYLLKSGLPDAEFDGTLRWVASTYDAASDRLNPGIGRAGSARAGLRPASPVQGVACQRRSRRVDRPRGALPGHAGRDRAGGHASQLLGGDGARGARTGPGHVDPVRRGRGRRGGAVGPRPAPRLAPGDGERGARHRA